MERWRGGEALLEEYLPGNHGLINGDKRGDWEVDSRLIGECKEEEKRNDE